MTPEDRIDNLKQLLEKARDYVVDGLNELEEAKVFNRNAAVRKAYTLELLEEIEKELQRRQ